MTVATKKLIEQLWKTGISWDNLRDELISLEEKAEKEAREKKARLDKKRKEMIAALANYLEEIDPTLKLSAEDLKDVEKEIARLEKVDFDFKPIKNNEEIILNFLKTIGV